MFQDREKLYQIYHTVLSTGLTWALTLAVNHYFTLKVPIPVTAIFALIPSILIYLFDINRKNAVSYLLLFGTIPILALFFWIRRINPVTWITELARWCNSYDGTEELYVASHATFMILFASMLASILFYLFMKRKLTKFAFAAVLLITLVILSVNEIDVNKYVVGIGIFYILTVLVEICGIAYSRKAGTQNKMEGILYLAPICLLLAVISVASPSKAEPIQWKMVKNIYRNVKEQIDIWMSDLELFLKNESGEFSVSFTGYSEDNAELNNTGSLNTNQGIAMMVSGHQSSKPMYLIGSVNDIYTGYSWEKSGLDYLEGEQDYFLDYAELVYALARQERSILEQEQLVERRSVKVRFADIRTKSCFYPIKTSWIYVSVDDNIPNTERPSLLFPSVLGRDNEYETLSFEMNLKGAAFQRMLREADTFSYEDTVTISEESMDWIEDNIFRSDNVYSDSTVKKAFDKLKERSDLIRKLYTVLPETLPDSVRSLAEQIAEGCDNDYDRLKALEAYVSNYSYTLTPGKVPKDEDFVHYFLFESKEGWCTSFASSMAILGRCLGIPTRYVEGFVVTFSGDHTNSMYHVRNNQAHAWIEAYITGVGWIPFEPTPQFFDMRYITWKEKLPSSEVIAPTEEIEEELPSEKAEEVILEAEPPEEEKNVAADVLTGVIVFVSAILILLMILMTYYFVLKLRYRRAYDRADISRRMYMVFLRTLALLQREGFAFGQQETICMYADRISSRYRFDDTTFMEVADIFMRYRYAQAAVTDSELSLVKSFHNGLKEQQRKQFSPLRLWGEEFLFLTKKSNR